jgi:hypothetical protein
MPTLLRWLHVTLNASAFVGLLMVEGFSGFDDGPFSATIDSLFGLILSALYLLERVFDFQSPVFALSVKNLLIGMYWAIPIIEMDTGK